MSLKSGSQDKESPSPLRGFNFTRDWLAGGEFAHGFLPDTDLLIKDRLHALGGGAWKAWSTNEIEEVREFNQSAGNHSGAGMVDALANKDALAVVTGQQPDFMASPLYVLHKALSACAWAKQLSGELGHPVIPVFWVASDDDDFAELKRAWMVSFSGALVDVGSRLSRGGVGSVAGTPAYLWEISESGLRAKEDLRRSLAGWPGEQKIVSWLEEAMDTHSNFESFFCFLLQSLLGDDYSVLFVAPRLKVFRRRQASVLATDTVAHRELNAAISNAAIDFQDAGYSVTLERDAEALNFFWLHEGTRHRLKRVGTDVVATDPQTHQESMRFSEADLLTQLETAPENFAPNVVTRPVIQDMVLPTLAYIAGPGELAYLAVLGEAYRQYGCVRSAVILRTSVTMRPGGDAADSVAGAAPETISGKLLSQTGDAGKVILGQLSELASDTAQNIGMMRASSSGLRPEVQTALDKTERHFLYGIEQLKKRLARQVARDEWNRAARLATLVVPAGGAQERMLSPWNFVKAGEWDALAHHLATQVDYTSATPQTALLPSWMETAL